MKHALVRLARTIDWRFLEGRFGTVYTDKPGQPPLPTRLMAGLAILKHSCDLSDEVLCDRWVENPYFQYFCGEEFFQHALALAAPGQYVAAVSSRNLMRFGILDHGRLGQRADDAIDVAMVTVFCKMPCSHLMSCETGNGGGGNLPAKRH
jgi:hypothetical protein